MGGDNIQTVAPGIPNITGAVQRICTNGDGSATASSAIYTSGASPLGPTTTTNHPFTLNFDASRANKIYGAAETVQPPSFTLIPQIKY